MAMSSLALGFGEAVKLSVAAGCGKVAWRAPRGADHLCEIADAA